MPTHDRYGERLNAGEATTAQVDEAHAVVIAARAHVDVVRVQVAHGEEGAAALTRAEYELAAALRRVDDLDGWNDDTAGAEELL